ncbi:MAG: hypothetical protein KGO93_04020 [Cyanobacteria bacterium REEB446]|nr:hypothetical protein [Cyanobacteria bacterium REEB446]
MLNKVMNTVSSLSSISPQPLVVRSNGNHESLQISVKDNSKTPQTEARLRS